MVSSAGPAIHILDDANADAGTDAGAGSCDAEGTCGEQPGSMLSSDCE